MYGELFNPEVRQDYIGAKLSGQHKDSTGGQGGEVILLEKSWLLLGHWC